MKNRLFSRLPLLLGMALMMPSANASAQGTVEDYNRAYAVNQYFQADSVYNWARYVAWCDSSHVLHYQISTPQGKKYISYNADKSKKKTYDNYEAMRKALGIKPYVAEKPQFGRVKMPHWMEVDEEDKAYPVLSPDGKTEAYIEGYNVVVHEAGKPYNKAKRILTQDGTIGKYYSNRIQWSPDGKYILVCKRTPVEKRYVYYVESSPEDQLQPILHKQEYAKPGDMVPQHYPVIINVATGEKVEADPHQIENQYELEWLQWTPDSKEVTMEYNQRGHHLYQMLAMNAKTGALRVIVEEKANTFVNYSRLWRKFINNGKQLLWTSERDNWNHIYLYDVATGKPIRQITKGEWFMREVLRVDEEKGEIYFSASGVNKNEDPYFIHCYKINMDGCNMIDLTPEEGTHSALFSYDFHYLVDTYSKIDTAPVTVLRDARSGKLLTKLETADLSKIKEYGWRAPEVFVAKGRDGKTDMWGMITRPTNFDPNKKYPIIEYIYSGPGDAYVPKSFHPHNWTSTSLAELGFIVVQLDAMGTSYRGKKFEEICYKNLKDAGLPDRILWIKEAAKKYPYMDIDNVAIYGMSAGGQESTTAVLTHGDFYKAAYSSCGCHDNRMDKIWWNEQWMSWPVDSSYVESSNVEMAHKLERPLMLVLGEIDDNVDPSSTYQLVNALIKANKEFEFVIIPGADHTMGEDFGEHKRYDFFVKNLLGIDPPKWNLIKTR